MLVKNSFLYLTTVQFISKVQIMSRFSSRRYYEENLEDIIMKESDQLFFDLLDKVTDINNNVTHKLNELSQKVTNLSDEVNTINVIDRERNNLIEGNNKVIFKELTFISKELNNSNKIPVVNSNQQQQQHLRLLGKQLATLNSSLSSLNTSLNSLNKDVFDLKKEVYSKVVHDDRSTQLPQIVKKCVKETIQPMFEEILKSCEKGTKVRLVIDQETSCHSGIMDKEASTEILSEGKCLPNNNQSLIPQHPQKTRILKDQLSSLSPGQPIYQNGTVRKNDTFVEKRKYSSITPENDDDETCLSVKKVKTNEDEDEVISFLSKIKAVQYEDYWDNSEIIQSKWCRYCLCYSKLNTHNEDTCDYNIQTRLQKNGQKSNLCKFCGQLKSTKHEYKDKKCIRTRKIMMKLYDIWPRSVEKLGFNADGKTFRSTFRIFP